MRRKRCWPTGRPRDCSGEGRLSEKILVSGEMEVLEVKVAEVQVLGERNTEVVEEEVCEEGWLSLERESGERKPMW